MVENSKIGRNQEEIARAHTLYLTGIARRMLIATPDNVFWVTCNQLGFRYLSREGVTQLRATIRSEKKANEKYS
jgi:hypothetical protein